MILVKNRLKKKKNIIDDDEYLNYLKFSHLEPTKDNIKTLEVENKATQLPDILNNFSQTDSKDMVDKETDTYDELNKIIGNYILKTSSSNFKSKEPSRADKMTMAWTQMIAHKDKPQGSSSSDSDSEGALSRNIRRGFRLAEMAGNAVATTFNVASDLADFLVEATAPRQQSSEEEEAQEIASGSDEEPVFRERSRSHDEEDVGERLLRRGASRSRSSTPKGYPPKKQK